MGEGDTLINAVIGAVVSVVLSPLQFSPVIGGAVAGYLQGSDSDEGVRVGALSGLFTAIPFLLIIGTVMTFFLGGMGMMYGPTHLLDAAPIFLVVLVLLGFAFIIALSALGGFLGAYLKREDVI